MITIRRNETFNIFSLLTNSFLFSVKIYLMNGRVRYTNEMERTIWEFLDRLQLRLVIFLHCIFYCLLLFFVLHRRMQTKTINKWWNKVDGDGVKFKVVYDIFVKNTFFDGFLFRPHPKAENHDLNSLQNCNSLPIT